MIVVMIVDVGIAVDNIVSVFADSGTTFTSPVTIILLEERRKAILWTAPIFILGLPVPTITYFTGWVLW